MTTGVRTPRSVGAELDVLAVRARRRPHVLLPRPCAERSGRSGWSPQVTLTPRVAQTRLLTATYNPLENTFDRTPEGGTMVSPGVPADRLRLHC